MGDAQANLEVLFAPISGRVYADLNAALAGYDGHAQGVALPFDAAVGNAFGTDRLAWAFVGAYRAALQTLVPGVEAAAFCVTEAGGNHPRAIQTTLDATDDGFRLVGEKTFVTFGAQARELLVLAREGEDDQGRPKLAVCRIPAARRGVTMQAGPETPFVPEITHAHVRLDSVSVGPGERLAGDGYANFSKLFRTVEDLHVVGAVLAYVAGVARRAGANDVFARCTTVIASLRQLASAPPSDRRVHVALHGAFLAARSITQSDAFAAMWSTGGLADEHVRWKRDAALLHVASGARKARFEKAMNELGPT